ncbi:MerR family transcriptional regulator [Actinoplanes sp. N902-109]|uniref:MerR family transcriptional regulator n=1 Tax=Actinoplanes sp. (strain N902-109) TaxID=649831 RepID=UPI00032943EE|nr:MerR family transcriptional regulator [Actinoplanes sp. N902-109]AGL15891.1 MerR family transcriptional regulator [Actinoplanes sp. N902-109]
MRIGDVAARAGVSVRALRYYEEQGLIVAQRSGGGHRHFPDSVVEQVKLIQQFYAAGVPSHVIRAVLPSAGSGTATPQVLEILRAEWDRLDRRTTELAQARDRLATIIDGAEATIREGRSCAVIHQSR